MSTEAENTWEDDGGSWQGRVCWNCGRALSNYARRCPRCGVSQDENREK